MRFLLFVFMFLIISNSIDKTLSVNPFKKLGPTFAEIFGEKWANEIIGENENENQNETNQNANFSENKLNADQTDQSDDQQKRGIIHKFHAIKERIKKRGKYSAKKWNKIELKIAKKLGIRRMKIYKWKKQFNLNEKDYYEMKKKEFVERIEEFKRIYKNGKQKQFADELGIHRKTIQNWKKEFGIEMSKSPIRFTDEQKMSKMNDYYEMKNGNRTLTDQEIAGILKIGSATLRRWKKL